MIIQQALSYDVEFEGVLKSGDGFHLDSDLTGIGDSMQELVSLRTAEDRVDGGEVSNVFLVIPCPSLALLFSLAECQPRPLLL